MFKAEMDVPQNVYYSTHTENVNYKALPYLEAAIVNGVSIPADAVQLERGSPFVICEYGACDASGSFEAFTRVIDKIVRKFGPDQQVMIIYEDLEGNDYGALFSFLQERAVEKGESLDNVFTMATARSFHRKCVPSNTVHLGFSSFSLHYLSKIPRTEDHVSWVTNEKASSEEWKEQAARDWENLLLLRARELAKGGRLVFQMTGRTDQEEFGGGTRNISTNFFAKLDEIFSQMCEEGILDKEEFVNTRKNTYARSLHEIKYPFRDESTPVSKAGLRLKYSEVKIVRCPFNLQWTGKLDIGDANMDQETMESSVHNYIKSIRPWSQARWGAGLSSERSEAEKATIMDTLYSRYAAQVSQQPRHHGYDMVNCVVCVAKEG